MQIGRKIYYEILTGNVIYLTESRSGNAIETTTEQDFVMYAALHAYVPETVGCIQLDYGQYEDKFGLYHYSVNKDTGAIVWGDKINPDISDPKPTLEQQLIDLKQQNLTIMSALAELYETVATTSTI